MERRGPPGPPGSPERAGPPGGVIPGELRGQVDEEQRMWAMLAHLSAILVPVIGPLAVWFMKQDESEYVAYHAAQALYWSGITVVGTLVITVVTCGAGSFSLAGFWLATAYVGLQAKEGTWLGYWFIHPYGYGRKLF